MVHRRLLSVTVLLVLASSAPAAPRNKPNDREWGLLTADYQWLETLRKAQPKPPAGAARKGMIETELSNLEKLQPTWNAFHAKGRGYYDRSRDPRAASLSAKANIVLDDHVTGV